MAVVCLYHGDCWDGVAAAWTVREAHRKRTPATVLVPVFYNEAVPHVAQQADAEVIIVDFSYPAAVLIDLIPKVKHLTLLDHHADVKGIVAEVNFWLATQGQAYADRVTLRYRADISGAMITWRHYFPVGNTPTLFRTISDYDRWVFKYNETRQVMAGLNSYPKDIEVFDHLMHMLEEELYKKLHAEGDTALRLRAMEIAWAMEHSYRVVEHNGERIPLVCLPKYLMNETLDAILRGGEFKVAFGYYDTGAGRRYSVRTRDDVDAREYCRPYNGSGHFHAAGFRVPYGHALTQL